MQCGTCDRHKRRLTCAHCAQSSVWPLRTEFLFKTAERDLAAERVQEHLEGLREVVDAREEDLRERIAKTREETRRLRDGLGAGSYLASGTRGFLGAGLTGFREGADGEAAG